MSDFNKYNNGENGNKEAKNSFWDNIPSPYDTAPKSSGANSESNPHLESNHKTPVIEQDVSASQKEVIEPIAEQDISAPEKEVIEPIAEQDGCCDDTIKDSPAEDDVEVSEKDTDTINWDAQSGVYHGKPPVQDDFNKEGGPIQRGNDFGGNYGNNQSENGFGSNYENNNSENTIPTVKKGKVIFWPLVCFMIALCTVVAVYLAEHYMGGINGAESNEENSGLPSHEYTSSVIEHIEFEEPKNEIFTDKVELYDLAQKSCVTVICTVETKILGQTNISYSMGSGFVVSEDGYIVTNSHVVEGAKSYKVRFYDGTEYNALLIGNDEDCDVAVVKIKSDKKLYPASIGDSDKVRVGDFSMAIGTPSNEVLYGTMTFGIISGKDRELTVENNDGQVVRTLYMIQTDTTLNPGNSGGPLFNMYGQVIGINTMKLMDTYEGIGFAIPISGALPIINSLISTGKSDYADSSYVKGGAQIGISGLTLDEDAKKTYGFSDSAPKGVLIKIIQKDSAAYKAGVSAYDVITEFNGTEITDAEQLSELIKKCSPKEKVTLKVYREGRNKKGEYLEYSFELNAVGE